MALPPAPGPASPSAPAARGLFAWGPPPPPSFMDPEDLAAMMAGAHSAR